MSNKFANVKKEEFVKPIDNVPSQERFKHINNSFDDYMKAMELGLSYSQYLERLDPSCEYSGGLAELDAYERQLYKLGLSVSEDGKTGTRPVPVKYFLLDEEHRILFKEFLDRTVRAKMFDDRYDVNSILATTRFIQGESAKGVELDFTKIEENPYVSIGKGAEIPIVEIGWSDTEASLAKKGVAVKYTYEFLRRANIDMVRLIFERIALADKKSTFNYAASYLFTGSPVTTVTSLDSAAAAGDITYKAWLSFLETAGVYTFDTVITSKDVALKILLMSRPELNPSQAMALLSEIGVGSKPKVINVPNFAVAPSIYVVPDGTFGTGNDDKALFFDSRYALERIVEQGSEINETQKFITSQHEVVVQTINEGFTTFMADAKKVLQLA